MNKYIPADKLKAEIERLYDIARKASYNGEIEGEMTAYDKILSFIDSLQQENPEQTSLPSNLDEAARIMADECLQGLPINGEVIPALKDIIKIAVRYGADWMAGQGVTIEDEVCELYDKLYLYYIDDCSSVTPDTSCEMLKEIGASKGDKVVVQIRKSNTAE